jgi:hypothetical protein
VSKYSVMMHELAEINLCLRNLDGAAQSTNQSHQVNETVHPINTHQAPGSAERSSVLGAWGWVCSLIHSPVCGIIGNHPQECAVDSA